MGFWIKTQDGGLVNADKLTKIVLENKFVSGYDTNKTWYNLGEYKTDDIARHVISNLFREMTMTNSECGYEMPPKEFYYVTVDM